MTGFEGPGQEISHGEASHPIQEGKIQSLPEKIDGERTQRRFEISDPAGVSNAVETSLRNLLGEDRCLVTILGPSPDPFRPSSEGKYIFETLRKQAEASPDALWIAPIKNRQFTDLRRPRKGDSQKRTVYFVGPLNFHKVRNLRGGKDLEGQSSTLITGSFLDHGILSMVRALEPESSFVIWIETNMAASEIQYLLGGNASVLISSAETHSKPTWSHFSIHLED